MGNLNNKKYKKLKIVLCTIGIILIFAALRSIYLGYMSGTSYEEKGLEIADAIISDVVFLIIGLLCLFSPLLLKLVNFEKIAKMKEKIFKICKRNASKVVDICFWVYLGISLLLLLSEEFMTAGWTQIVSQHTKLEILFECFTFIIMRSGCTKFTCYIDIFRNENCY